MRDLSDNPVWQKAMVQKKWMRLFGVTSAIFLAIALVALLDGLIAQMREGANELDILPGQIINLSGPAGLKNPVSTDLIARFEPPDSPLTFELEGFFTGYWFGSGMWRGQIHADPQAKTGIYQLRISFRGASAQSSQIYILKLYASQREMRAASFSLFKRFLDVNPFILAATLGGLGIALGLATYFFGHRYAMLLLDIGLVQIYRSRDLDGSLWCYTRANLAPREGTVRMVFGNNGLLLGEARAVKWQKGRLHLVMLDGHPVDSEALVCLVPPEVSRHSSGNRHC